NHVLSQDASTGLHSDVHAIVADPANPAVLWVGTDGGVWRSADRSVNWQNRNTNLVLTQFVGLDVHPNDPSNAVGGTQDNGTNAWLGSNDWQHISDGDGGLAFFQRTNGQNIVGTRFAQANNLSGVFFSTRGVT